MRSQRELELERKIRKFRRDAKNGSFGAALLIKSLQRNLEEAREERIRQEVRAEYRRAQTVSAPEEAPKKKGLTTKQKVGFIAGAGILGFVLGARHDPNKRWTVGRKK